MSYHQLIASPSAGVRLPGQLCTAVAFYLMLTAVALAPFFSYGDPGSATFTGEGNAARQVIYLLVFGLALVGAEVTRFPRRLWALPLSLTLALLWSFFSLTWALSPQVGGRRFLLTLLIAYSIFIIVQRLQYDETIKAVRRFLVLVLILNYVAIIWWPQWAIHQDANELDKSVIGAWRGILMNKNFAGPICTFTILFYCLDAGKIAAIYRIAVVVAAAFFLTQTQSKTSMFLLPPTMVFAWLFLQYNPRYRGVALHVVAIVALAGSLVVTFYWKELASNFTQHSLTGRLEIWPLLVEYWRQNPLGAGFGSFWNIGASPPMYQYNRGWVATLASGHNGYLDLLVQIGVPGLALVVTALIVNPLLRLLTSFSLPRSRGTLLLACIVFAALHNLTESTLFDRDAAVNVFLLIAACLVGLHKVEAKVQQCR